MLWIGLYHPFEGTVFPFLSLLEAQILEVIITSFETRLAGVLGWICLMPFSFYVKVINKIMLWGGKKKKDTSFTHCNCSLLKSVGNSVFLMFCNHKVPSFSRQMSLWIQYECSGSLLLLQLLPLGTYLPYN